MLLNQCPITGPLQWICGCRSGAPSAMRQMARHRGGGRCYSIMEFENGLLACSSPPPAIRRAPTALRCWVRWGAGMRRQADLYKLTLMSANSPKEAGLCFAQTHRDRISDGMTGQHSAVMNAFAAAILRGEPLVAGGEEDQRLMLSNAMHPSSGREMVSLPVDEDEYLNA